MTSRIHRTTTGIAIGRCVILSLAVATSVAYAGGAPQINTLSDSTLSRSGRLLIFGSNFGSDPEWRRVSRESQLDGRLLTNVESVFLDPTDFSPMR